MHNSWLYPLPFLLVGGFVAFWCLVVKLISLLGWRRLARYYAVPAVPAGRVFSLTRAHIGSVKYDRSVRATATAQGLGLSTMALFSIGHPPLLIPWVAFGPIQAEKFLWVTTYTTRISLPDAGSMQLSFTGSELLRAAQPWLPTFPPL
ncbi:hypothetical protein E5K00_07465 [Hymenobacter aquaticus]|uniref:Uncharacterized protein n=1 Tax=Hymenobacter aquaticus TaxID=1867101 RepID=A0A4Z0Q4N6_9BACT|nr:hypothetical protein [Hymenobacter aquaticus]TGE25028.1 hypothetical protein E5K00_07465 [Hymenobacter aquaticus]